MNLKQNVNKLHSELNQIFSEVNISENFDNNSGEYVQLVVKNENKQLKLNISKRELEKNTFNWSYFSNPLLEGSDLVQRTSTVSSFLTDIKDIFEKNRFSEEYLQNLN